MQEIFEQIQKFKDLNDFVDKLYDLGFRDEDLSVDKWDAFVSVEISSLEELHEARVKLRGLPEGWEDTLGQVWNGYRNVMFARYHPKQKYPTSIRLKFVADSPPPGFLKEGCKIVMVQRPNEYEIVCDI